MFCLAASQLLLDAVEQVDVVAVGRLLEGRAGFAVLDMFGYARCSLNIQGRFEPVHILAALLALQHLPAVVN